MARGSSIPAIAEYERGSGGRIGVHAENLRTGATLSWRADERFVMCSTQSPIRYGIVDVPDWHAPVARANPAKGPLTVGEMCAAAVEKSDNTSADLLLSRASLLLSRINGPSAVTAFWRRIGDETTRLDDFELALNFPAPGDTHDTTTPSAMASTLRRPVLGDVLSDRSRRTLTEWLLGCRTGANRLRAGLPSTWRIGDKTGNNGGDARGDIAVAWSDADTPIVMSVCTRGGSPSARQVDAAFAGIGRHVATHLPGAARGGEALGHCYSA